MIEVSYVASVYSLNATKELMQKRYEFVKHFVATNNDKLYLSPIVYSHHYAVEYNLPKSFDFWRQRDFALIDHCDSLTVLMMDGWKQSQGVQEEIAYAKAKGMDIYYVEVDDN